MTSAPTLNQQADAKARLPRHPAVLFAERDCLGLTCLNWSPSGELDAHDGGLVLERLAAVDANLAASARIRLASPER